MSVPKSRRKDTPLKVAVLSVQLLQKTIEVCSSKNNFPIRKKWAIPSDLYLEAREFCVKLNLANDIRVENKATAEERLSLDRSAESHLKRYTILTNVALLSHPLNESTSNSWCLLLGETTDYFNKWKQAEEKRFMNYIEG